MTATCVKETCHEQDTTPEHRKLTVLTVTFWLDRGALQLQARSLRYFLDPEMLAEFLLIVSDNDLRMLEFVRTTIVAELGILADKVCLRSARDYGLEVQAKPGWRVQQALKLLAVATASTPVTLILDSKNHLVRPLTLSDLFAGTGKLRSWKTGHWNHMQPFFEASFAYFGVPFRPHIGANLPTITPFLASRRTVRELLAEIGRREEDGFVPFFLSPGNNVTEFFLLASYITKQHGSVQYEYEFGPPLGVTVFDNYVIGNEVNMLIEKLLNERAPFFALHWAAIPNMTEEQRRLVTDLWVRVGLAIPDDADSLFAGCGRQPT